MARRTATINKKPERAVIIGAGITEKYYFSHLQSLYNLKIKIRPRYFGNENISTLEKLMYSNLWKAFEYLGIFTTENNHSSLHLLNTTPSP